MERLKLTTIYVLREIYQIMEQFHHYCDEIAKCLYSS